MRTRTIASWFVLPALAAAALVTLAPAADAGHGNSCGRGRGYGQRRVTYVQPGYGYYARPVYAAPRYQRVVVVRPRPYVRIGGRFGSVNINAVFGPRRQYSSYQYGCNFCDSRFTSYEGYSNHVQSCSHRPSNCQVQARQWNNGDCGNGQNVGYDDGYGYNSGYDNSGYDPGYNDGYAGGDYEDGN